MGSYSKLRELASRIVELADELSADVERVQHADAPKPERIQQATEMLQSATGCLLIGIVALRDESN